MNNLFEKLSMLGVAMLVVVALAACGDSEEEFTITISNSVEDDTPLHEGLMKFKEVAEEESDGRLNVEVFSNAELYASEREAIEAVQAGNIRSEEHTSELQSR